MPGDDGPSVARCLLCGWPTSHRDARGRPLHSGPCPKPSLLTGDWPSCGSCGKRVVVPHDGPGPCRHVDAEEHPERLDARDALAAARRQLAAAAEAVRKRGDRT
jgi:hypothetical protein